MTIKGREVDYKKEQDEHKEAQVKLKELQDLFKDLYYCYAFTHSEFTLLLLGYSIFQPFFDYHFSSELTQGWVYSILNFFGILTSRAQREDRKKYSILSIAMKENIT